MPANTKLLLHFDEEPWVDSSAQNHIVAEGDNDPLLDASIYKWTKAVNFTGDDSIYVLDHTDWQFTGDFTIELWAYFGSTSQWHGFCGQYQDADDYWSWRWDDSVNGLRFQAVRGASSVNFFSSWSFSTSTWYHLALVRNGDTWYHFVDGNQQGTTTDAHTFIDLSANLYIGKDPRSNNFFRGRMDELRISDVARWTSNFTPSATPYVGVEPADTILLKKVFANNVIIGG